MAAPEYRAPRWLANPHLQTIYGSLLAARPAVRYRRERWETPDGDFVDVDHVDGLKASPGCVLFHGLEGSSDSPYARTLMHRVHGRGWRGSVVHFRGCSGEPNRLPRAYHSGDADEMDWVAAALPRGRRGGAPLRGRDLARRQCAPRSGWANAAPKRPRSSRARRRSPRRWTSWRRATRWGGASRSSTRSTSWRR